MMVLMRDDLDPTIPVVDDPAGETGVGPRMQVREPPGADEVVMARPRLQPGHGPPRMKATTSSESRVASFSKLVSRRQ